MWVLTPFGFFSIVAHRDRPKMLLVRARDEGDLKALVRKLPAPRPRIQRTPGADYLFRVAVSREALSDLLAYELESMTYPNFKNEVAVRQGPKRAEVYHRLWRELLELQRSGGELDGPGERLPW